MNLEHTLIYLIIGIIWTGIWEYVYYLQGEFLTNPKRMGYLLFWPIGFVGFVFGVIVGIVNFINRDKSNE